MHNPLLHKQNLIMASLVYTFDITIMTD